MARYSNTGESANKNQDFDHIYGLGVAGIEHLHRALQPRALPLDFSGKVMVY